MLTFSEFISKNTNTFRELLPNNTFTDLQSNNTDFSVFISSKTDTFNTKQYWLFPCSYQTILANFQFQRIAAKQLWQFPDNQYWHFERVSTKKQKLVPINFLYLFQLSFLFHFFLVGFLHFYFGKHTVHNPQIYQFDLTLFMESRYKLKNLKRLVNTIFQCSILKKLWNFSLFQVFQASLSLHFPGPVATLSKRGF